MFYKKKYKILYLLPLFVLNFVYSAEVYFSPEDKIADNLVSLMDGAQTEIHLAVFVLTYKKLADALIRAKKRGLDVQIVVDSACLENTNGKINLIKKSNIEVFIFKNKSGKYGPKMHNKFVIIDRQQVVTGSFNWTWSADKINEENIVILNNKRNIIRYEDKFEKLKKRCVGLNLVKNKTKEKKKNNFNYQDLKQKMVGFLKKIKDVGQN